ncbi:MAG TPA: hypothetical protein VFN74_22265 [Chloroflexota bacterium]|nr:hypothetical protein [Chloroflexota bacterium]
MLRFDTPSMANPLGQAYRVLHAGFVIAPIVAGLDKFFNILADWTIYLAPVFPSMLGIDARTFMYGVGIVEILAGVLVALVPRIGAYVVMGWLWGIIANLFLLGQHFDIALRDFGLSLGALSLGRLAQAHHDARMAIERSDRDTADTVHTAPTPIHTRRAA